MTNKTLPARQRAHQLIVDAIATGVRGDLLDALKEAERLAAPSPTSRTLTQLHYDRLQPGQKLLDPDRSGLLMRHGKRTGKGWFFRYSHPVTGKQIEHRFGTYPDMSLSDARDRWAELRAMRNQGKDPATIDKPKATRSLTVSDLVDAYLSDYARKVKRSHQTDERLLKGHLVPAYGSQPAADFGHDAAAELLHRVHENSGPREAEKLRACISTMFNFATGRTRKVLVKEPLLVPTHPNPVKAVLLPKRPKKDLRKHDPSPAELTAYVEALDTVTYAPALRLQLLTMCRIQEVTGARWAEIDLDQGRWTIPPERMKAKQEHVVLLSPQALDLLRAIKAEQDTTGIATDYVFPAPRGHGLKPIEPKRAQDDVQRLRDILPLHPDFTSHSLRIAGITWLGENLCPDAVQRRMTAHSQGSDAHSGYQYAKYNQPAKEWWARWADYLDTLTTPNVVPLTKRA